MLLSVERVLLVATIVLPFLGWVLSWRRRGRAVTAAAWASAASALALLTLVLAVGPVAAGLGGSPPRPVVGAVADTTTASLLVLVCGVGAVVQSFQSRYLRAGPSSARCRSLTQLVVGSMAVVTASATLAELVVAWVLASVAFVTLLSERRDLVGTAAAARAARRAFLVGDGSLVAAATLVLLRLGDVSLQDLTTAAALHQLGAVRAPVALLVTVAAAARAAQGPFRRWLSLTVAAPTPTSALLHAGVVNGAGILLVRLGGLAGWAPAMAALLVVSGATIVASSAASRRRPDAKGRLAMSTASQMGFMLAEIAVGLWPAAVVHLIGHGCYKASRFLSAGTVTGASHLGRRPVGRPHAFRAATAGRAGTAGRARRSVLLGALAVAAAGVAVAPGVALGDGPDLAAIAAVAAAVLGAAWWSHRPARGAARHIWPLLLVAAAGAYGALVGTMARALATSLPVAHGLDPSLLLVVAGAALAFSSLDRLRPMGGRALPIGSATPVAARPATARPATVAAMASGTSPSPLPVPPLAEADESEVA